MDRTLYKNEQVSAYATSVLHRRYNSGRFVDLFWCV
jgi:hypothetical protein